VSFALAQPARARIDLYDVRGARVRRLLDEERPAGASAVAWDGLDDQARAVPAGLYFAIFSAEGRTDRARVVRLP
jgi:flagellar hook assembly protein FlgD